MPSLAIVTLTHNEEKYIKQFIEAAKLCHPSEIIVIDDNSTDKTVEIAKSCGAVVYNRALNGDFATQRNFALEQTKSDYIFFVDADEFITEQLASIVKQKLSKNQNVSYSFWRRNIAFGKKIKHGILAPDCVVRIFPKGSVVWQGKVHERPVFSCDVVRLDGFVWHYTYRSWEQYWRKFDSYTTIGARQNYQKGKRITAFGAFMRSVWSFFKMFILKKGFMDGFIGLFLCCNHFSYTLAKYNKLLLLQQEQEVNDGLLH